MPFVLECNPNSEPMTEEQKITIDRIDMGAGWVCFKPASHLPDRPAYLHHAFFTWLQRNHEFKVRATLPIVEHGSTVTIHVWFE